MNSPVPYNPATQNPQQAQTVTNILSGEKSYRELKYAITGDPIADLLAGIQAVINSSCHNQLTISYVLECAAKIAKAQYEWQWEMQKMGPHINPVPYQSPIEWGSDTFSMPTTTSGGMSENEKQSIRDEFLRQRARAIQAMPNP
jgi:hypothetical protein